MRAFWGIDTGNSNRYLLSAAVSHMKLYDERQSTTWRAYSLSLYVRLLCDDPKKKTVLIYGHYDVQPVSLCRALEQLREDCRPVR